MLSEMTAMNSTLLLLNALALAVLVIFHFQPEPATAEQYVHTYNKPLAPLPQVAVMNSVSNATPHLTTDHPAANLAPEGERWVF